MTRQTIVPIRVLVVTGLACLSLATWLLAAKVAIAAEAVKENETFYCQSLPNPYDEQLCAAFGICEGCATYEKVCSPNSPMAATYCSGPTGLYNYGDCRGPSPYSCWTNPRASCGSTFYCLNGAPAGGTCTSTGGLCYTL